MLCALRQCIEARRDLAEEGQGTPRLGQPHTTQQVLEEVEEGRGGPQMDLARATRAIRIWRVKRRQLLTMYFLIAEKCAIFPTE